MSRHETDLAQSINQLTTEITKMAAELATLQAAVAANTTIIGSAIALIQGIKTALDAAIATGDPAALTALSTSLGTEDAALSAAIVANTPAPPPVVPPPAAAPTP
jgi:hypothetical protein